MVGCIQRRACWTIGICSCTFVRSGSGVSNTAWWSINICSCTFVQSGSGVSDKTCWLIDICPGRSLPAPLSYSNPCKNYHGSKRIPRNVQPRRIWTVHHPRDHSCISFRWPIVAYSEFRLHHLHYSFFSPSSTPRALQLLESNFLRPPKRSLSEPSGVARYWSFYLTMMCPIDTDTSTRNMFLAAVVLHALDKRQKFISRSKFKKIR